MPQRTRMSWNGAQASAAARAAVVRGVRKAAEHVLAEANKQVPHERGDLLRSGQVDVDPSTASAVISYDTPYAVRQHEELDYRHDPGRKAKYLEDPMRTEAPVVRDLVGAEIRRALDNEQ